MYYVGRLAKMGHPVFFITREKEKKSKIPHKYRKFEKSINVSEIVPIVGPTLNY